MGWCAAGALAGGVCEAPSAPERWVVALGGRSPLPEAPYGTSQLITQTFGTRMALLCM